MNTVLVVLAIPLLMLMVLMGIDLSLLFIDQMRLDQVTQKAARHPNTQTHQKGSTTFHFTIRPFKTIKADRLYESNKKVEIVEVTAHRKRPSYIFPVSFPLTSYARHHRVRKTK